MGVSLLRQLVLGFLTRFGTAWCERFFLEFFLRFIGFFCWDFFFPAADLL